MRILAVCPLFVVLMLFCSVNTESSSSSVTIYAFTRNDVEFLKPIVVNKLSVAKDDEYYTKQVTLVTLGRLRNSKGITFSVGDLPSEKFVPIETNDKGLLFLNTHYDFDIQLSTHGEVESFDVVGSRPQEVKLNSELKFGYSVSWKSDASSAQCGDMECSEEKVQCLEEAIAIMEARLFILEQNMEQLENQGNHHKQHHKHPPVVFLFIITFIIVLVCACRRRRGMRGQAPPPGVQPPVAVVNDRPVVPNIQPSQPPTSNQRTGTTYYFYPSPSAPPEE